MKRNSGPWDFSTTDPSPEAMVEEAHERIAIIMAEGADEKHATRRAWERIEYRYGKENLRKAKEHERSIALSYVRTRRQRRSNAHGR